MANIVFSISVFSHERLVSLPVVSGSQAALAALQHLVLN